MVALRSGLAWICVFVLVAPVTGFAADANSNALKPPVGSWTEGSSGLLGKFTRPYTQREIAPARLANSGRLDSLMRAGNIYLSLRDCIALALENNIDIEIQRYVPQLAEASLITVSAGGSARSVTTAATAGPSSATGSTSAISITSLTAAGGTGGGNTGPAIPNLEPVFTSGANWAHITNPQSSAFTTGTNFLINSQQTSNAGIQKGFLTGTTMTLALTNSRTKNNSLRADFNPATNASLSLTVTQRLLQGFGWGTNSRQIRIARNNREISDLTFKLQVVTTVGAVMQLYWDLVSFNQQVKVAQDALAASNRLLQNNRAQVDVGTLAPIEIVRAEAQIASNQQALVAAQMRVLQQEAIIKTALSRTGLSSPAVADAHIVPTDTIEIPAVEPVAPIQELMATAISSRPELAQSRIQLRNQELTIRGSKSALKPSLDVTGNLANNALAGQPNELPAPAGTVRSNVPFFVGGYGKVLTQIFSRNFPNYSAGFSLNIPIRNRTAQAQVLNDELTYRQQQLAMQRQQNQVRVDVQNALIGVTQARALLDSAMKAVSLQEATVKAEEKKLEVGASTIYNVILTQRDLVTAQSSQVAASAAYAKARVDLDRSTGQLLNKYDVSLDEAFKGVVSAPPSAIPATPPAALKP
jgi:outer membrane protein